MIRPAKRSDAFGPHASLVPVETQPQAAKPGVIGSLPEYRVWEPQYNRLSPATYLNWLSETEIEVDFLDNSNEPKKVDGVTIILEQFTGLRDSGGVKIFVGDWVEFTYWWFDGHAEAESTLSGEVIYDEGLMSFALRGVKNKAWLSHVGGPDGVADTAAFAFWRFSGDDFHVRGNVHQHPGLLG